MDGILLLEGSEVSIKLQVLYSINHEYSGIGQVTKITQVPEREQGCEMKKLMLIMGFATLSISAHGADRIITLDKVLIEEIKIQGKVKGWMLQKICLDGAAYYVLPVAISPSSIAPVFNKLGKPELCEGNLIK